MANFIGSVKTINSAVRTLLLVGVFGILGFGGWHGYTNYIKPGADAKQALADLEELKLKHQATEEALETAIADKERLEISIKLLKIQRRIANVTVLEKGKDEEGKPYMEVAFTEVDEQGDSIGTTRNYTIYGNQLYVDGWVVSFKDKYVENADELRSASMYVFKSIYGDDEKPSDGQRLDIESSDGGGPGIYKSPEKREFEEKIWSDFWRISNDESLQEELGIEANYGNACHIQAIEGKTYQIHLRASGSALLKPTVEP